MRGYRDLVVWQKAMELVTDVYRVTSDFPKYELYGLTGQIRRAAVSVPSNLAEDHGRTSRRPLLPSCWPKRAELDEC
jgi:four helix bundle protein